MVPVVPARRRGADVVPQRAGRRRPGRQGRAAPRRAGLLQLHRRRRPAGPAAGGVRRRAGAGPARGRPPRPPGDRRAGRRRWAKGGHGRDAAGAPAGHAVPARARRGGGRAGATYARYSDDIVALVPPADVDGLDRLIRARLAERGLEVNEAKSAVAGPASRGTSSASATTPAPSAWRRSPSASCGPAPPAWPAAAAVAGADRRDAGADAERLPPPHQPAALRGAGRAQRLLVGHVVPAHARRSSRPGRPRRARPAGGPVRGNRPAHRPAPAGWCPTTRWPAPATCRS